MIAADGGQAWRLRTPRLPIAVNGAGDLIAALFFCHWLQSRSAAEALAEAASSVYGIVAATAAAGARELQLVEAQDELIHPTKRFRPEAMSPQL
jgi:pyridoxine kinase